MNSSNSSSNIRSGFNQSRVSIGSNMGSTLKFNTGNTSTTSKSRGYSATPSFRMTSIGTTKLADNRPLLDKTFQNKCCTTVFSFLVANAYQQVVSFNNKSISGLGKNEYIRVFSFIMSFIRKDYEVKISKVEDDLPRVIAELGYPGVIAKHTLMAIGAPNSNGQLIALLAWMVELAEYLMEYEDKLELENDELEAKSTETKKNDNESMNEQRFLLNAHKELHCTGDFNSSYQQYSQSISNEIEEKSVQIGSINDLISDINKQSTELKSYLDDFQTLGIKKEKCESDLKSLEKKIMSLDTQKSLLNSDLDVKLGEEQNLIYKREEFAKEEKRLELVISSQEMSKEIYERKKHLIESNSQQIREKQKLIEALKSQNFESISNFNQAMSIHTDKINSSLTQLSNVQIEVEFMNQLLELKRDAELYKLDYNLISNSVASIFSHNEKLLSSQGPINVSAIDIGSESETCVSLIHTFKSFYQDFSKISGLLNQQILAAAIDIEKANEDLRNDNLLENESNRTIEAKLHSITKDLNLKLREKEVLSNENNLKSSSLAKEKRLYHEHMEKLLKERDQLYEAVYQITTNKKDYDFKLNEIGKSLKYNLERYAIIEESIIKNIGDADHMLYDLMLKAEECKVKNLKKLKKHAMRNKKSTDELSQCIEKEIKELQSFLFDTSDSLNIQE